MPGRCFSREYWGRQRLPPLVDVGINPIINLPVGDNLHDHVYVPVSFRMDSAVRKPSAPYMLSGLFQAWRKPGES